MSVRQYVGARYVPKFSDLNGGVWDNTYTYEALTIVKHGNDYYTSRKPVPTGIAITNTEYWVLTGDYNGAISELNDKVDDNTENINELSGDVNSLETTVTSHTNRLTEITNELGRIDSNKVDKISNRKFLFVGDSYIGTHTDTCVEKACTVLGITNFANISVSGSSFSDGTFLSQLSNYSGDKTTITDIFVIGGLNDSIYSSYSSTLPTAITTFFNYAKSNYTHANIHVCFAGHALDDAPLLADRTWEKRTFARWMYQDGTLKNGGTFHGDMWQALVLTTDNMGTDRIHPSATGQELLSYFLVSYILGEDVRGVYPFFKITNSTGVLMSNLKYTLNNDSVMVTLESDYIAYNGVASQSIQGNAKLELGTTDKLYFNHYFNVPCLARAVSANNKQYQNVRGYLIFEGNKLYFKLNELSDSAFTTYTFGAAGNITFEFLCMDIPIINLL